MITNFSEQIKEINVHKRLQVDKKTWPPVQPKMYTPLVLIQYQDYQNPEQIKELAKFVGQGHIDQFDSLEGNDSCSHEPIETILTTNKIIKKVEEILLPLETSNKPQFILIEGVPGIRKSFLSKEIAYRWGDNKNSS